MGASLDARYALLAPMQLAEIARTISAIAKKCRWASCVFVGTDDPDETHSAGFSSIAWARVNLRKSASLNTTLPLGDYLVAASRGGEGEPGNNSAGPGVLAVGALEHHPTINLQVHS
jgi:hypothetical protein